MNYRLSVKASEDIEQIWLYTFDNWSREQADRYIDQIFNEIEYLSNNPEIGKDYSHIRKNYRCTRVKSHLIFYKITGKPQGIDIIRVLHQRMDLEQYLGE